MPLYLTCKEIKFGVGDRIRVVQKIVEAKKNRQALFEGIVIAIKGGENPSFVVRRLGEQNIAIERIFPALLPSIEKVQVLKKGTPGVKHAKLYYLRSKSPREIEKIYTRASRKNKPVPQKPKVPVAKRKSVLKLKNAKNKTSKITSKH